MFNPPISEELVEAVLAGWAWHFASNLRRADWFLWQAAHA